MSPRTIIVIGASGAGKGTQAALLKERLLEEDPSRAILRVESGAILRKFIEGDGFANSITRKTLKEGKMLPAFLPIWVWADIILERLNGSEHIIFDGAPRKLVEARVLDEALTFFERKDKYVVFIDVSENWSRARMKKRRRFDDVNALIDQRLEWYKTDVLPAVEFLRQNKSYKFLHINGEQTIDKVHADIVKEIF